MRREACGACGHEAIRRVSRGTACRRGSPQALLDYLTPGGTLEVRRRTLPLICESAPYGIPPAGRNPPWTPRAASSSQEPSLPCSPPPLAFAQGGPDTP